MTEIHFPEMTQTGGGILAYDLSPEFRKIHTFSGPLDAPRYIAGAGLFNALSFDMIFQKIIDRES